MIGWQPIETAPRDGTRMLLIVLVEGRGAVISTGHFMVRSYHEFDRLVSVSERWEIDKGYDEQPTLWMPLPELPAFIPLPEAVDA